ncbi:hypothetical protein ABPE25_004357 [Salmonella enterica subsp. enterica serovar Newport]|uniref:hypothetical protein n=1 Tax=Salmonella enterica TaxID=28901 RepID=UPI002854003C|nr:hypothetical protein [Salmonella enterica subsp. enterica serovar Newport]EHK8785567.1 hypothetical protein [Salmonella enterica subsp. enterica serovar Bardo]EJS0406374.1 hypothetical protein [Salmonella enterica subsp. enterica serovar Newport]ELC2954303.1 hypothetical protein [Salmonella enterica]
MRKKKMTVASTAKDEDPESYPVVDQKEHAPAIGSHLPTLSEIFTCKAHRIYPEVIASPERQRDK